MTDQTVSRTNSQPTDEEDQLVQSLYDKLIDSISTEVACGMHRMVKTGTCYSDIINTPRSRKDLYPSIHGSTQEMEESLQKYVVEVFPAKRPRIASIAHSEQNSDDARSSNTDAMLSEDVPEAPMHNLRNTSLSVDIWGRIPPKEPKAAAKCPVCSRHISTLRFAPHLDKCMGIGTMTRVAAQNHNSIVP
jgi:Sgf11 (transcriptional regulation protein)